MARNSGSWFVLFPVECFCLRSSSNSSVRNLLELVRRASLQFIVSIRYREMSVSAPRVRDLGFAFLVGSWVQPIPGSHYFYGTSPKPQTSLSNGRGKK